MNAGTLFQSAVSGFSSSAAPLIRPPTKALRLSAAAAAAPEQSSISLTEVEYGWSVSPGGLLKMRRCEKSGGS